MSSLETLPSRLLAGLELERGWYRMSPEADCPEEPDSDPGFLEDVQRQIEEVQRKVPVPVPVPVN